MIGPVPNRVLSRDGMVLTGLLLCLCFMVDRASPLSYQSTSSSSCRCIAGQSCFPQAVDWNSFNQTVGGRLILPHPTGYPCYPASFNANSCQAVQGNLTNGFFLADQPGSMQNPYFEEVGSGSAQRCPIENATPTNSNPQPVCQQGLVSVYGLQASSVVDVQAAVLFASQHNLRLSVKNTGHDYAGRSVAAGSFMLWMHRLNSVVVNMTFSPTGCSQVPAGPAVTISGGPQWRDVYAQISAQTNDQYVLMGGMCPSVGAAGGYVQGGGHGPLGSSFGLAVDHVLEFQVVTADGVLRVVNQCSDPDLFWALRGGGGGTFGVVTSITSGLNPSPASLTSFQITVTPTVAGTLFNSSQMQQLFTVYAENAAQQDAARWGGYFEINPVLFAGTYLIPQTLAVANQTIEPFRAAFASKLGAAASITVNITAQPSFQVWHSNHVYPGTNFDATGFRGFLASRLIPVSALDNPEALGMTLATAASLSGDFLGLLVAGQGARERDTDSSATAVSPSWRKALLHVVFLQLFTANTPQGGDTAAKGIQTVLDVLKAAYPGAGAYFSESYRETDWKGTFWGTANYERLLKVKQRVDPTGFFYCIQCVGSDAWDASGNCPNGY